MSSRERTPIYTRHGVMCNSGSKRASANPPTLTVIHHQCPYCNHPKGLSSVNVRKCAKCKKDY
jgi:hypothetical protein